MSQLEEKDVTGTVVVETGPKYSSSLVFLAPGRTGLTQWLVVGWGSHD